MRRIRQALAVVTMIVGVVAMIAEPAFAWHVTDASAHCDQGQHDGQGQFLHVQVKLSDAGPGDYHDSSGNSGTFGNTKNIEYDTPTFSAPLIVTVHWTGHETKSATIDSFKDCEAPPTTTTTLAPTTTTTEAPTTTSTEPPTTTTTVEATTTTTAPPETTTTAPPETTTTVAPTTTTVPPCQENCCDGPCETTTSIPATTTSTVAPTSTTTPARPSTSTVPTTSPPKGTSSTVPPAAIPRRPSSSLPFTGGDSRPLLLGACTLILAGLALTRTRKGAQV